MAEGGDKSVEEMMKEVQLLELQAKRMEKLVAQRREERAQMETENARIERQIKYMAEMVTENEEAEAEHQRQEAAKAPFSGKGFTLGDPSPSSSSSTAPPVREIVNWVPVKVDPSKPSGNIQVRLVDGSRMVVKLNTDHKVSHIKQEIMAKNPEQSRQEFKLLTLGPPSKLLKEDSEIGAENLMGSAVIQRIQ